MAIRVTAKELRVFSMKRPMGPILYDDLGLTPVDGVKNWTANVHLKSFLKKCFLTLMQMLFCRREP